MKKNLIFMCLIGVVLLLCGCDSITRTVELSGDYIEKEYNGLDGTRLVIESIHIKNGLIHEQIGLTIQESSEKKIVVKAQESLYEKLTVKSNDGKIKISANRLDRYRTDYINISIYGYSFDDFNLSNCRGKIEASCIEDDSDISLSNASKIDIENDKTFTKLEFDLSGASYLISENIEAKNLEISLSGASRFELKNVQADSLDFNLSGASFLIGSGNISEIEGDLSGASKIAFEDVEVNNCKVELSGASNAVLNVSVKLEYSLSGASVLNYKGDATLKSNGISGASSVEKCE